MKRNVISATSRALSLQPAVTYDWKMPCAGNEVKVDGSWTPLSPDVVRNPAAYTSNPTGSHSTHHRNQGLSTRSEPHASIRAVPSSSQPRCGMGPQHGRSL